MVVQGASGSGKSSLVIAGALPELAASDHTPRFRVVGPFTPGNAPLEGLVDALAAITPDMHFDRAAEVAALRADAARLAQRLDGAGVSAALIVVDQFEEVLTLCGEEDRRALVDALCELLRVRPNDRIILTLREEFGDDLERLMPLSDYLDREHSRFSMQEWTMGSDELRAAIERPAAMVNLQFAPGVVDQLVDSVIGNRNALPLLQFALKSLWERRDRNRSHARSLREDRQASRRAQEFR